MNVDLRYAATAFATAFTIIDPVGMIPLTLGVTANVAPHARQRIVNQAVLFAAGIVLFMGVLGRSILGYLGITLSAFSIAGGILLFLISIDMLFARKTGVKRTDEEEREAAETENPAVFPLAVPMLAGPGTIATVLLLESLTHGDHAKLAVLSAAYAAALGVSWLCMSAAASLRGLIGNTGIHVITRLLGMILAALAVQFVLNALAATALLRR